MDTLVLKVKYTKEYMEKYRAKDIEGADVIAKRVDTKVCGRDYKVIKEDRLDFPVGLILGGLDVAKEDRLDFPAVLF